MSEFCKQVLKWDVPIDDRDHPIGGGRVVHVGIQNGQTLIVRVWTEEWPTPAPSRRARVYGTGHPVAITDQHIGSVIADPFVWHVYGSPIAIPDEPRAALRSHPDEVSTDA